MNSSGRLLADDRPTMYVCRDPQDPATAFGDRRCYSYWGLHNVSLQSSCSCMSSGKAGGKALGPSINDMLRIVGYQVNGELQEASEVNRIASHHN